MRLIDAEKGPCKGCGMTYCHENCKKYYDWLEGCDYDVEAVVAELEKETVIGADCVGNGFECIPKFKAISIVRGKE
jgi:hypothetical protein